MGWTFGGFQEDLGEKVGTLLNFGVGLFLKNQFVRIRLQKSVKSVKFSLNGSTIKTLQNQNLKFNICKNPITEVKHCVGTKITHNSSSTNVNWYLKC